MKKNNLKKYLSLKSLGILSLLLINAIPPVFGQSVEMADVMRSNGKIYVVVASLGLILTVLLFLIIRLDLKLTRIESKKN